MTTTPGNSHPKQIIRLSERDCQLVLAGLNWIASNYQTGRYGHFTSSLKRVWQARFDPGIYQQEFMDRLLALRATLSALGAGGRLRLTTSFEVAACALAVRVAVKRHRHGHIPLDIPRIETASKRLLRRLEVVRKRAKRAEIRRVGSAEYKRKSHEWRAFVQWIRYTFRIAIASGGNGLLPVSSPPNCRHNSTTWTLEELMDRKAQIPDDYELRRLVKLQLRYVRRGRTRYTVADLLNDKGFFRDTTRHFRHRPHGETCRLENIRTT